MRKLAPITKLVMTLLVSIWTLLLPGIESLTVLVGLLLGIIVFAKLGAKTYKTVVSLFVIAFFIVALQYVVGAEMDVAVAGGLRMLAMTFIFIILLGTTRLQDMTAALVQQCKVPYEYAFMFTAALRFVPDLISEMKAVQEAQSCRGYVMRGNFIKKLGAYLSVVQPLVLRSVSRSETMAMALELRGFGAAGRSFMATIAPTSKDYAVLTGLIGITAALALIRMM